eukprot:gene6117-7622_t
MNSSSKLFKTTSIIISRRTIISGGKDTSGTSLLTQRKGKDGKLYTVAPRQWNESLSSPSEAIVKAERDYVDGHKSFEELQKLSVARIGKMHKIDLK